MPIVALPSSQQLAVLKYEKPAPLGRYNGGLIFQDSNGDGHLDPMLDRNVRGVIA